MPQSRFNLRNLFLVNGLVDLALAAALLVGPDTVLKLFRLSTDPTGKLMAQLYGGSLVALGVIALYARSFTDLKARDGAAMTLFLASVAGFVVSLLATLGRVLREAGWPTVLVFLAFALSYGYLQFIKQGE